VSGGEYCKEADAVNLERISVILSGLGLIMRLAGKGRIA